jgi:serine/threonine protein kinase
MSVEMSIQTCSSWIVKEEQDSKFTYVRAKTNKEEIQIETAYTIGPLLDSGYFACVHEVVPPPSEEPRKSKAIKIGHSEKLKEELEIYPYLRDIPFYSRYVKGFAPSGIFSGIILRKMETTLSKTCETLPFPKAILISEQLAKKLKEIHEKGIAHGDVRLPNIMYVKKYGYQFIDFGNAHNKGKTSETSFNFDVNQDIGNLFSVMRRILVNDLTNPTLFAFFNKHPDLKEKADELVKPCQLDALITRIAAFKAEHPSLFEGVAVS